MAVKLVQRIGLVFLPAKVASWRYQVNISFLLIKIKFTANTLKDNCNLPLFLREEIDRWPCSYQIPMKHPQKQNPLQTMTMMKVTTKFQMTLKILSTSY